MATCSRSRRWISAARFSHEGKGSSSLSIMWSKGRITSRSLDFKSEKSMTIPFFTGPSAAAVATRSAFSSGLGRIRRGGESAGVSTGPVGRWTYTHRHALRIGAVALAAVIFVFWGRPTAAVTIVIAVLLLVVLGLIELIGRPPPHPAPTPPATGV